MLKFKSQTNTLPEFKIDDVPLGVREAWIIDRAIQLKKFGISISQIKQLNQAIVRFPEWFPEFDPKEATNDPIYDDETPSYITGTEDGI